MDVKARMTELVETLNKARYAYYQTSEEIMSNYEYDALYDELERLEKESGIILPSSPTQEVGYEVVSALPKVRHALPMKSLNKTKDIEELAAFLGNRRGMLSWKLDGLTIVLTYEEGKLVQAATRGNGEIGEVIDIIKKNGGTKACSDAKLRNDLVEEMADVLMYYNDVLLCYGISAEELKQSYSEKYLKNMKRW